MRDTNGRLRIGGARAKYASRAPRHGGSSTARIAAGIARRKRHAAHALVRRRPSRQCFSAVAGGWDLGYNTRPPNLKVDARMAKSKPAPARSRQEGESSGAQQDRRARRREQGAQGAAEARRESEAADRGREESLRTNRWQSGQTRSRKSLRRRRRPSRCRSKTFARNEKARRRVEACSAVQQSRKAVREVSEHEQTRYIRSSDSDSFQGCQGARRRAGHRYGRDHAGRALCAADHRSASISRTATSRRRKRNT